MLYMRFPPQGTPVNVVPLNITSAYVIVDQATTIDGNGTALYRGSDELFNYVSDYLQADSRLLQSLFFGALCGFIFIGVALMCLFVIMAFIYCFEGVQAIFLYGMSTCSLRTYSLHCGNLSGESVVPHDIPWLSDDVLGPGIFPPRLALFEQPLDVDTWEFFVRDHQTSYTDVRVDDCWHF